MSTKNVIKGLGVVLISSILLSGCGDSKEEKEMSQFKNEVKNIDNTIKDRQDREKRLLESSKNPVKSISFDKPTWEKSKNLNQYGCYELREMEMYNEGLNPDNPKGNSLKIKEIYTLNVKHNGRFSTEQSKETNKCVYSFYLKEKFVK